MCYLKLIKPGTSFIRRVNLTFEYMLLSCFLKIIYINMYETKSIYDLPQF